MPAPARARPTVACQRHHFGDQVEIAAFRLRHQGREMTRIVHDVGVGQQHESDASASATPCATAHSLPLQPGGAGRSADNVSRGSPMSERSCRCHRCCRRRPATTRMPRVVLGQQRAQRCADQRRLVACRHHHGDGRRGDRMLPAPVQGPTARTGHAPAANRARSAVTAPPASSCTGSMPLARNQATASSTAARAGRGA